MDADERGFFGGVIGIVQEDSITLRYNAMVEDIRSVQSRVEGRMLRLQPAVVSAAAALWDSDRDLARAYLTDYGIWQGERVAERWAERKRPKELRRRQTLHAGQHAIATGATFGA